MKTVQLTSRCLLPLVGALLGALLWAGCASKSRIDWSSRVGKYTYDQAVIEMGPPDKSATLSDGTVVAQWLSRRGHSFRTYHLWYGGWIDSHETPPSPDQFLTLTFDPEHRLKEWKWIYK